MALSCVVCACGGSATPAAQSSDETPAATADSTQLAENGGAEAAEAAPRLPSCDDGTCFACGDTICLAGFYCDADAPGGPACSWLPACTQQGLCGCLKRELGASCRCEEKSGGAHVTCS
jgi:hypothetical protein